MSRQSLEIRFGQHLTLTPALQQSIKLLQLSTLDLEAEVARALDENPLLEPDTAASAQAEPPHQVEQLQAQEAPRAQAEYASGGSKINRDDEQSERPEAACAVTLRDHLLTQLHTTRVSARDAALVELLIDDLSDDGFLESSLPEIHALLDESLDVDLDELQTALRLLQSFDPPGIGARDLGECLWLQLQHIKSDQATASKPAIVSLAQSICREHLPILASGNMGKLKDLLGCEAHDLQQAHACILALNPRPASPWTKPPAEYAVPDVIVRKTRQGWQPTLNEAVIPRLRINEIYAQALGSPRGSEHTAMHGQLQEARWLIRNVAQRFETILRVSVAIVAHQQAYFTKGWGALRPLTLREIAAELGLHESTVSRATTQKFMLTPFGTVELKRFFGAGLATEGGEATSSTAVQTRIRDLIQKEDRHCPLSDGQLADLLDGEGITIARRTVAKYRELLRIPTASLRKSQAQAQASTRP
jgi:RNA polymerase sigma-54 factor